MGGKGNVLLFSMFVFCGLMLCGIGDNVSKCVS